MGWIAAVAALTVIAATYAGSGTLTTRRGVYPLQDLRYLRAESGRGALQFTAGLGAIGLSGDDAEVVSPQRLRLHVDRLVALSSHAADGLCDARMDAAGRFSRITCKGALGPRRERFTLIWAAKPGAVS